MYTNFTFLRLKAVVNPRWMIVLSTLSWKIEVQIFIQRWQNFLLKVNKSKSETVNKEEKVYCILRCQKEKNISVIMYVILKEI